MKNFKSFQEIELELHRLHLERKIALEEMKGLKYEYQEILKPYYWIQTGVGALKRVGIMYLIRKIFK